MPTFYNFTQDGNTYSFDDVFVPADLFRTGNLWSWGTGTTPTTFDTRSDWRIVSSGGYHAAAIKNDGTLWLWGNGNNGRLGNNSVATSNTPITTFLGGIDWKQVSCGYSNTTAVKTDGTLWTWGLGSYGKLGNNSTTDVYTPITTFAGGTNWKQVSSGGVHTSAIKTDGTLWIWGSGGSGKLGNNSTTNVSTPITTFSGGNDWKQVSCSSYYHTSAIKTDGTLWIWGDNAVRGNLGINDTLNRSTPVTTFAGGTNWKQVSLSSGTRLFSAAVKTDGTLWTWGYGRFGILGNNIGLGDRFTPVTTFSGGTNWKQVFCGSQTMGAVKTDGTLWSWGRGGGGTGTSSDNLIPVTTASGGTDWKYVSLTRDGGFYALKYIDPTL